MSKKRLFAVAFILILSVSILTQVPIVNSTESSSIDYVQQFLVNIANIELDQYQMTIISNNSRIRTDIANLIENSGRLVFTNDKGSFDVTFSFINRSLFSLSIYPNKGPITYFNASVSDPIEAAKTYMSRLREFTQDERLDNMITTLNEASITKATETHLSDIVLTITSQADSQGSTFSWITTYNGCGYSGLSIHVDNGVFSAIRDDRSYIRISDPAINISRQEAIDIGWQYVKSKNFTVDFVEKAFDAMLHSRGKDDPITWYPYWNVGFPFVGPSGAMLVVDLWAGTGEIFDFYSLGYSGGSWPYETPVPSSSPEPLQTITPSPPSTPSPPASQLLQPTSSIESTSTPPLTAPTTKPTATPNQQTGFFGTNLPAEYGYAIIGATIIAVVAVTLIMLRKHHSHIKPLDP